MLLRINVSLLACPIVPVTVRQKKIIKLRKQDQDERDEHESLLDVYMRAMDEAGPAPVAEAA